MATRSPSGKGRSSGPPSPELVREALSFIPPDIGNDERVRIAFAVWDALGDAGGDLWLDWAGQRSNPDHAGDRSSWKSARKPGPVKVGTLFGVAMDHGFTFPADEAERPAPDPAALAAAAAERERLRKAEEELHRQRADQAARDARELWAEAERKGDSPYLLRKGVQAHGVRFWTDGTLIVPMRTATGEMRNVQRIAPRKPAGDAPEKRFMPGGQKKELLHLIGGPVAVRPDACTGADEPVPVLLLGEGYATAASLHEATGRTVAVCFDAGNMRKCAAALRDVHPTALIVACGDDDTETAARTGKNPGRLGAESAARAALTDEGATATVFPAGLPEGSSDFNDLHAASGLAAVRDQVEAVVSACLARLVVVPEAAAPWDSAADVPLDELMACAAADGQDSGASSPPPSPDEAAAPHTPEAGEGAVVLAFPGKRPRKSKAAPADPKAEAAALAELQRKYKALMERVGHLAERFTFIYGTDTAWDALKSKLISITNMRLAFGKEPVSMWLARPSRRMIDLENLVFEPGVEVGDHQVNMFEGLGLDPEPATAADVEPMLRLLRHLCSKSALVPMVRQDDEPAPDENADDVDVIMDWVLRWMALPLQQVGTKMATALIVHGPQGSGKNLFFDAWRDLYGKYGKTIGQTEIEDKYNEWISCKLAFVANEVVSRQEIYHRKDALKMIVTEGKDFPIRGMHMATRWERNAANIVFLSNQRVPLALDDGDRRHLVIYTPLAADDSLYQVVVAFLERGGLAKWLHYLQAYDVGDFNAHTKPPMTRDKERLIQASWKAPARFASDWMEGYLDLPMMVCSGDQLYRAFQRWCVRSGERFPPNRETFTEEVHRWAAETAGRDQQGRRLAPRLECKPVQHKDATGKRRSIRTWIPDGCGPRADVKSLGEWAFESAAVFQKELDAFCGSLGFNEGGDK